MTTVAELQIAAPVAPWQQLGLTVTDGTARIGGITLRFVDGPGQGVTGWTLADAPTDATDIDGLPTEHGEPPAGAAPPPPAPPSSPPPPARATRGPDAPPAR